MSKKKALKQAISWMLYANASVAITGRKIPDHLVFDAEKESGFFLGLDEEDGFGCYVGKPSDADGNILIVGTNGCGKSHVLAKSSMETWRDPFVALDIKGELSRHYEQRYRQGDVERPYVVFDPMKEMGHYNPYALLNEEDLMFVPYVREITQAIIPMPMAAKDPYWIDMARNLLSAAIVHYFCMGYDFSETMLSIQGTSSVDLCRTILASECEVARMFLNEITGLKPEQRASIASELKRHTMVFATDPYIQEALSLREGKPFKDTISWEDFTTDVEARNVFLRLDQDKLEHWGGVIRLMITQLVRQLERRPEKHTPLGRRSKPILVLLDEFPLIGRMDLLASALSTLRSKQVTFCLLIQSLAQLDWTYGRDIRKVIVENCQWKAMLQITEPESQEYFSKLIGNAPNWDISISESYCSGIHEPAYTRQIRPTRKPLIYPECFSNNPNIVLHTPDGSFLTFKQPVDSKI